jgi:hypothetical protein
VSTPSSDETAPGPLQLLESARVKYQLALGRLRRGSVELALLSLHGAIEDVLRGHGLRLQLPEAYEPFAQLLDALTTTRQRPLSPAEAEGVRRMHRLRARVAHGEQIVVTRETIEAYQRLAARLLPRYGVLVVGPEEEAAAAEASLPVPSQARRERDTVAMLRDEPAAMARRGDTARIEREPPRRERTVYPDGGSATYLGRARPSRATADLPLARQLSAGGRPMRRGDEGVWRVERQAELWARVQGWLLPALAIISIFLVGMVIATGLQRLGAEPPVPTAVLPDVSRAGAPPQIATTGPAEGAAAAPTAAPTAPPPGALAPGMTAYVTAVTGGLNVRAQPGTAESNAIVFNLAPGTAVEIIGGPAEADGLTWWQVRGPLGEGWSAGQYLELR